jgi:4-amino-4-deoxy-L-arabinose transferase-like glycosyltransferase
MLHAGFSLRRPLVASLGARKKMRRRTKLLLAALIFLVSYTTKSLQSADLAPVMYTTGQPFGGLTQGYDLRAVSILEGEGLLGPRVEPSQTQWVARPPGYSIFLSAVYRIAGRDFFKVQLVQNALNSISPVLIFLIAGTLISWRVGVASGIIAALSHHLSHISNFILPDSLCALPLLAAIYLLALSKRHRRYDWWFYIGAGVMLGLSVWFRAQAMLIAPFLALMLYLISSRRALKRALLMTAVSFLVISPITIRNYIVYGEFIPISLGIGLNLWEGIADASGDRFGAVARDEQVAEQEAALYDNPAYAGSWSTPDGIKRDRDRMKKSLDIIVRHPVWYAGVMMRRMGDMLKYSAHAPLVLKSDQVDVFNKSAPIRKEWRSITPANPTLALGAGPSWLRWIIRTLQRATKETMQLFIVAGLLIACALSLRRTAFLLMLPIYYLLFQSFMHTEFRYTLPMHYFLFVLAAIAWTLIGAAAWKAIETARLKLTAKREVRE